MTEQVESLALCMARLWVIAELDRDAWRQLDQIAEELLRDAPDSAAEVIPTK